MAGVKEESATMSDVEDDEEDEDEEELDPRVQAELERLNTASVEINKLESELELSRTKFRCLLTEFTKELNLLYKKLGKCVVKVRPYFAMLKDLQKAQAEAQRSVVQYQRANSIYKAAREMVALAEERVMDLDGSKREFDSAWQEMLNHATSKFMESEVEKARSEEEHLKRASECAEISKKLKEMEKEWHRSIPRSRPYFEVKEKAEYMLAQEKQNVEDIQLALHLAKQNYRDALGKLEEISEEVHRKRKFKKHLPPRTPGVGAENDDISISSDLPAIYLDGHLEMRDFSGDLHESDVNSEDSFKMSDNPVLSAVPEQTVLPIFDQKASRDGDLSANSIGSAEQSSNAVASATSVPVAENYTAQSYNAGAASQTSKAQIKLQPTAKASLPVVPAASRSSPFSVLSVQDLLAGERCERVTRQIQSIDLHNQASDPMQFLSVGEISHLNVPMPAVAKKAPKVDSGPARHLKTTKEKSVGRPISERESSKADGHAEMKVNETEASRRPSGEDLTPSGHGKQSDSITNNNLQSNDISPNEKKEIFV